MNDDNLEFVVDANRRRFFDWKELWSYRELFYFFAWRDVKLKYKQTLLGFAWAVLQPLMMMIIFTLFFGRPLDIQSQNLPYPVFVFSGVLLWTAFSSGLTSAGNSMVANAHIIKKVYLPKIIIPVSSIFVAFFDFAMSFSIFVALLLFYQQPVTLDACWAWPMAVVITLIATLGPGSLLAAITVKYRDFRYVIPFVIQVLFFVSPVIYPTSLLKYPALTYVLACSPMYAALEVFRYPLIGSIDNVALFYVSVGSGLFLLVVGIWYFKSVEDFFADVA